MPASSSSAGKFTVVLETAGFNATRPWQHVLQPLGGYLLLAEALAEAQASHNKTNPYCEAFNFGPMLNSNRQVGDLVETILQYWAGSLTDTSEPNSPHESGLLHLQIDKALHRFGWSPCWDT